ncbi:uncharacterized protein LOC122254069 [Penaeus japonicus]|uniref:uncharacterized protein LOC122254069 n=1 Tax=Penaeus japonicus TaxID=27405 RepID=UPI001C70D3FC|nr:uncharacterized protein LOC122254069 [Penaeus japonicus]
MSSISDLKIHHPNSVDQRGLPHHELVQPKRSVQKLRIGTSYVCRAIADQMKSRRVDVMGVQDTRWSRNKAREVRDGYKFVYGAANKEGKNGKGIKLSKEMENLVTEVY